MPNGRERGPAGSVGCWNDPSLNRGADTGYALIDRFQSASRSAVMTVHRRRGTDEMLVFRPSRSVQKQNGQASSQLLGFAERKN